MTNNFLIYLTQNNVSADELGKNWLVFEIIAIVAATLPWIFLIIYLLFLRKYRVRYFVNGELVNESFYKKNNEICSFEYNGINKWYVDEECTVEFKKTLINENIKLYGKN